MMNTVWVAILLCLVTSGHYWYQDKSSFLVRGQSAADICDSLHPAIVARIDKDLGPWKARGISDALMRNASKYCRVVNRPDCQAKYIRVLIENGTMYLTSLFSRNPGWEGYGREAPGFLLELYEVSLRYKLPNVELMIQPADEGDLCQSNGVGHCFDGDVPQFMFSRGKGQHAILIPYSAAFMCTMDSFDELIAIPAKLSSVHWKDRTPIAFGRYNNFCAPWYAHALEHNDGFTDGTMIPCARTFLDNLTLTNRDRMDVRHLGGPNVTSVPFAEQNQYRYLVNTDGFTVSSKMDKYLLLGSTILNQASRRFVYYTDAIQPMVHYMPYYVDNATDILQAVDWLRAHDREAHKMAATGRLFAHVHLNRESRLCYWRLLLEAYSKLFTYTPSCSLRKMCVPAFEELKWQAVHVDRCRIKDLLEAILKRNATLTGGLFNASNMMTGVSQNVSFSHGYTFTWPDEDQPSENPTNLL